MLAFKEIAATDASCVALQGLLEAWGAIWSCPLPKQGKEGNQIHFPEVGNSAQMVRAGSLVTYLIKCSLHRDAIMCGYFQMIAKKLSAFSIL